jgi:hypothetical protein
VDASARGPIIYPLYDLTAEQFGKLVFLLARSTDARAVPVREKDHGLDARLPDERGRTVRGWQAKRFARGGIHWGQCRDSVMRALAFWRPPRITFCFAHDLSAGEQESFRTELVARFPQVRLDFWSAEELQRLIRDTDEGQRAAAWLFSNRDASLEEIRKAMAVGGPLESTQQAIERQAVVQQYMDRDPHFRYTIVSRSSGSPETPPAPQTWVSVTLVIGGQEVRIDASERYPGAIQDLGAGVEFAYSDDDEGRRAHEAVERLMRHGGKATVSSGLGARMSEVPVGLQGLVPDEGLWGEMEIAASGPVVEAEGPRLPRSMLVCAESAQIGVTLRDVDSAPGWDVTLAGGVGGLEIFQSSRIAEDGLKMQMDWRYTRGVGSGLEQLLAVQVMLAALRSKQVDLRYPSGAAAVEARFEPPGDAQDWESELEQLEVLLGYVAELEAWLGHELSPPAWPAEQDAQTLSTVIPLIREPEQQITWQQIDLAPGAKRPDCDGPFAFALLRPLWARLFGSEVYLGMELLHFPEGRLEGDDDSLAIVPVGDVGAGTRRLHHPEEAPPEAANRPPE